MEPKLVYLSGAITGQAYDTITAWRSQVESDLHSITKGLIEVLDPLRGNDFLVGDTNISKFHDAAAIMGRSDAIYTRDRNDIHRCDGVLVNLLGVTKISIGTVMEVVWAREFNKPCVVVMEKDNIHNHPLFNTAAGVITDNLADAVKFMVYCLADSRVVR